MFILLKLFFKKRKEPFYGFIHSDEKLDYTEAQLEYCDLHTEIAVVHLSVYLKSQDSLMFSPWATQDVCYTDCILVETYFRNV